MVKMRNSEIAQSYLDMIIKFTVIGYDGSSIHNAVIVYDSSIIHIMTVL